MNAQQALGGRQHFHYLGSRDAVVHLAAKWPIRHQAAVLETCQVAGDIGLGTADCLHQIGHPQFARCQAAEDLQASTV